MNSDRQPKLGAECFQWEVPFSPACKLSYSPSPLLPCLLLCLSSMSLFFPCVFISRADTPVLLLVVLSGGNSYEAADRPWLIVFASKKIVPVGVSPSLSTQTRSFVTKLTINAKTCRHCSSLFCRKNFSFINQDGFRGIRFFLG